MSDIAAELANKDPKEKQYVNVMYLEEKNKWYFDGQVKVI